MEESRVFFQGQLSPLGMRTERRNHSRSSAKHLGRRLGGWTWGNGVSGEALQYPNLLLWLQRPVCSCGLPTEVGG